MSQVKHKDTNIEVLVRSTLHRLGYRFRKNDSSLPGSPDIVLKKYNAAIFIHGCFWHSHTSCKLGKAPSSRKSYWEPKLAANKIRDHKKISALGTQGWRVAVIWQCSLKKKELSKTISMLDGWLKEGNTSTYIEFSSTL